VRRRHDRIVAVVERELRTLARNRSLLAVAAVFVAVVAGFGGAATGSAGGYVSLTIDLLVPVELLVPVLAFAFVYRSVRGDDERGELDVLRTYPLSRVDYVVGVFLGRTAVLVAVVLVATAVAGAVAALGAERPVSFLATHRAGDTPIVYVRFVVIAVGYTFVVSALALVVSTAARTTREALGAAAALLLVVAVGLDLLVVGLLSGGVVAPETLGPLLAVSPASAFRGLVAELALAPALAESPPVPAASPLASAVGLLGWWLAALGAATLTVWRR
jgi:ABC-2 type transport system permease protein